jgi:hypothetical protein
MATKKSTRKTTKKPRGRLYRTWTKADLKLLRLEVKKFLKKKIGGTPITEKDVDAALPWIKKHIGKYINLYAFSAFSPIEMCVDAYVEEEFG